MLGASAAALLAARSPPAAAMLSEQEQRARIAAEVAQAEEILSHSGTLFEDPQLVEYLQSIADKLFADHPQELKLHVQADPSFNAYCWPSGGIYFFTGALLRMEDEAQLASVIGHEGTHYTADHAYKSVVRGKKTMGVTAFMIFADPLLTPLLAMSSLAGYSRDHEREADEGGFKRMAASGYAVGGAGELFERLDREFAACKDKEGAYFWASHPRVKERIENFKLLGANMTGGERNSEQFLRITRRARLRALESMHSKGDGARLVFLLDQEKLLQTFSPDIRFYLAEGFRLRNQPGDAERAVNEYQQTIDTAPQASRSYEALGLHHYRAGRKSEALRLFERFIELEPDPKKTMYAQKYVRDLRKEPQQ